MSHQHAVIMFRHNTSCYTTRLISRKAPCRLVTRHLFLCFIITEKYHNNKMPLQYTLKDPSAPLGELDIRQVDMLRFHMGSDRNIGVGVCINI